MPEMFFDSKELAMLRRALEFYVECEDVLEGQWQGDYDLPEDLKLAERVAERLGGRRFREERGKRS
jgi:hypothetical protein